MRPLLLLFTLVPVTAIAAPPDSTWQVEEMTFTAPDGVELAGSLYVPEGAGPFAGAVIIHGSGSSDRGNLWARTVARTLAAAGVATLLPDKRGSGESGGDWLAASFEVLARDALAGLDRVAAHSRVSASAVGLVGLSQGGHVAPLAATLDERVAWVVDLSGAAVTMAEQMGHEMANTAREAGLSEEGVAAVVEIQRGAERYAETGEWAPYAEALEAAKNEEWAEIAAGFPDAADSPVWAWLGMITDFDPIPHWKALDVPVFVAYGLEDEADNVPVAESVRRLEAAFAESGHEDATIRVYPGTGHALWAPDATQEDLRLHGDLVDDLARWLDRRASSDRSRGCPE